VRTAVDDPHRAAPVDPPATLIRSVPWWTGPHAAALDADPAPTGSDAAGPAVAVPEAESGSPWIVTARARADR